MVQWKKMRNVIRISDLGEAAQDENLNSISSGRNQLQFHSSSSKGAGGGVLVTLCF